MKICGEGERMAVASRAGCGPAFGSAFGSALGCAFGSALGTAFGSALGSAFGSAGNRLSPFAEW